jgi:hypothetical protein
MEIRSKHQEYDIVVMLLAFLCLLPIIWMGIDYYYGPFVVGRATELLRFYTVVFVSGPSLIFLGVVYRIADKSRLTNKILGWSLILLGILWCSYIVYTLATEDIA